MKIKNINILMKKLLKEYTNKNNKNILINNIKDCFGFNISLNKKENKNTNNDNKIILNEAKK